MPALLAGLSNVVSQPEGAQKVADAVRQQSTALGGFIDKLGPGNQTSLIDKGTQILSSLLGSRDQAALAGAVGSFAGVGRGAGASLLGILTPAIMGTIAGLTLPVSSPVRKTISPRHCLQALPICSTTATCLNRSATRGA